MLDAVPPDDVVAWISTGDVEAIACPDATLNLRLSTPNKLFECIAAGVPPVVSDLPGMRAVVLERGGPLGALCDPGSPATIARAIRGVLELPAPARAALRQRCLDAAARRWNWENQASHLLSAYDRLAWERSAATRAVPTPGQRPT